MVADHTAPAVERRAVAAPAAVALVAEHTAVVVVAERIAAETAHIVEPAGHTVAARRIVVEAALALEAGLQP